MKRNRKIANMYLWVVILQIFFCVTLPCYATESVEVQTVSGSDAVADGGQENQDAIKDGSEDDMLKDAELEEEEIFPTELDMGDYRSEMVIGEKQLLMVTVLPIDTTNKKLVYYSTNAGVATVNSMGRITAVGKGETVIWAICGKVQSSFTLTVTEDNTYKAVQDIEIGDYEDELNVDSTLRLSATILPTDATENTVSYESSDSSIASVSSTGEVKGVAPGKVTIIISAGEVKKELVLRVKVGTTAIELNSDYQVLKLEECFQIEATVTPKGAAKKLTYKSLDETVATVSADGLIEAKACGDTAIIVSNEDMQVSVSVVVNNNVNAVAENKVENSVEKVSREIFFSDTVSVQECPKISSQMLKYFYENEKILTVKGNNYTLFLDGNSVVNFENELDTNITFEQVNEGIQFEINKGNKLCGQFVIDVSEVVNEEKNIYLFNEAKQKYEKIAVEDINLLTIDTAGTYLLTTESLDDFTWNKLGVSVGVGALIIGMIAYIVVKKQYWFW